MNQPNQDAAHRVAEQAVAQAAPLVNLNFDTALGLFIKSNKDSQEYARICANMAISHFCEHGQVAKLQQFHDALSGNWNKKHLTAFKLWAAHFSPLAMKQNKFYKDKGLIGPDGEVLRAPVEKNEQGAHDTPFWEFKVDAVAVELRRANLVNMIVKLSDRLLDDEKFILMDDETIAVANGFARYANGLANAGNVVVEQAPIEQVLEQAAA